MLINTNRTRTVNDRQSELETTAYSTNNHAILISSPTQFAEHGLIDLLTLNRSLEAAPPERYITQSQNALVTYSVPRNTPLRIG